MEYQILGTLEVTVDGRRVELGPPKQRTLLAALLLHANQVVPTDRLVELVWGDAAPRTAEHSVHLYVSSLRKALDGAGSAIETRAPGYLLQVEPDQIDAGRFDALVERGVGAASIGEADRARELLNQALGLWRGPPLSEFRYEEFAQQLARRLEEARARAEEELAALELQAGNSPEVVRIAEALVSRHPLREGPRRLHMLGLYRAGRQADALRSYQEFRHLLGSELGIEPTAELRLLEERILLQDPSLHPAAVAHREDANPYKGLRAFDEADAEDFHGRDELVARLLERIEGGQRLLSVVGPSGSGKSSLVQAGLIPAIRRGAIHGSERWTVVKMVPGRWPVDELGAALRLAGIDDPSNAADGVRVSSPPTLLVVDQFEELFTLAGDQARRKFLRRLLGLLDEHTSVLVVITLRADLYDRPLLTPGLAEIFTDSVVGVTPMTPTDLEQAVIEPARRVGVAVDPRLLAELVADAADEPGALPLFQYTLTEMFERRSGDVLTPEDYGAVGGIRGAVSARATHLYAGLEPDRQSLARQVFLRLVQLTPSGATRRRTPVRELLDLGFDPLSLQEVLDRFGSHRLLTFDHDPVVEGATVEVAHEALLEEWHRLRSWIEEHREDLARHGALVVAASEWEDVERHPDYLLTGDRLAQYERWMQGTELSLTGPEVAFLEASLDRRSAERTAEEERRRREALMARRARWRLWALAASVTVLVATVTFAVLASLPEPPPDVAILLDGQVGDGGFNDAFLAGNQRVKGELGLDAVLLEESFATGGQELERLSEIGVPLILMPFSFVDVVLELAPAYPDVHYVLTDHPIALGLPNVTSARFADHEGSFLVGAAAGLVTETGKVGFVGGLDASVIRAFHAGFEAGVHHIDPDIHVESIYLTPRFDLSGFGSPTMGQMAARRLYEEGADVVYHAAGASGFGVFEQAAVVAEESGRHVWAIGVDQDQYESVAFLEFQGAPFERWKPHILTSMVKRIDQAIVTLTEEWSTGEDLEGGVRVFGLAEGGLDYATSGGFIDDLIPELEELRAGIVDGEIVVPAEPYGDIRMLADG